MTNAWITGTNYSYTTRNFHSFQTRLYIKMVILQGPKSFVCDKVLVYSLLSSVFRPSFFFFLTLHLYSSHLFSSHQTAINHFWPFGLRRPIWKQRKAVVVINTWESAEEGQTFIVLWLHSGSTYKSQTMGYAGTLTKAITYLLNCVYMSRHQTSLFTFIMTAMSLSLKVSIVIARLLPGCDLPWHYHLTHFRTNILFLPTTCKQLRVKNHTVKGILR